MAGLPVVKPWASYKPPRRARGRDAPIRIGWAFSLVEKVRAMENDRGYLTVEDVAKRFGVNATTVYRLVKRGRLPAFKVGSQWRFSVSRLDEWVVNRERIG